MARCARLSHLMATLIVDDDLYRPDDSGPDMPNVVLALSPSEAWVTLVALTHFVSRAELLPGGISQEAGQAMLEALWPYVVPEGSQAAAIYADILQSLSADLEAGRD